MRDSYILRGIQVSRGIEVYNFKDSIIRWGIHVYKCGLKHNVGNNL